MRTTISALIFGMLLAAGSHAQGQPAATPNSQTTYHVEFVIHDASDATAKGGRHYTMLIASGGKGTLKVGNRVPVPVGAGNQLTYIDVGTNIECRLREADGKVGLVADMDVSTVVPQNPEAAAAREPTISQVKINVDAMLEPGKRATVASIQDPVTLRNFEVETTVTRVQ